MNTQNLKSEIKKIKLKHVALLCTGIFLAFLLIGSVLVMAGGGKLIGEKGFRWDNFLTDLGPGTAYDVNDFQDFDMAGVASIEVSTVSNDVAIQAGGDRIAASLKGRCRTSGEPVYMKAFMSGDTLHVEVKYPLSVGYNVNNTQLTLTMPAGYKGDLSVTTVSGDLRAVEIPFELGDVAFHSVSGDCTFGAASYRSMKANTTSGDIGISGIAARTDASSTSGTIELDYAAAAETSVRTVSGDVSATIPDAASFSVDFGSVTGAFRSTHAALAISRAGRGFTSMKEGAPLIKVNTTSGDFRIEGK